MKASILISSYNRLPLFRRTLWSIANRWSSAGDVGLEVIVADEGSDQDILGELKAFSSKFIWKLIRVDHEDFTRKTGIKKFHNSPTLTNNIAFKHSTGDLIFQQGNEILAWGDVYGRLIQDAPKDTPHWMVMSTTFDVPQQYLDTAGEYGQYITPETVKACYRWPLQSKEYRSDVTNYISLAPRALWEKLNGYNERYFGGISSEDSDFVRRARATPGFKQVISEGISLHQFHGGKTCYYNPKPSVISQQRFEDGCAINHAIYHAWDGTFQNPQKWSWGVYGVKEVITNDK